MKKFINFIVNWIKKQSASVLISIALHVLVAIIARIFIVVNIEPQKEKKFAPPPPIERGWGIGSPRRQRRRSRGASRPG